MDKFDRARESIGGAPGYQHRVSTIVSPPWALIPRATWVVETIKTEDTQGIFLQTIGEEGGQRIVIPARVAEAIYRQHDSIIAKSKSERSKKAAETRRLKKGEPADGNQ